MRAERFHIRKVRALPSAPGHPCFSLTEDLHGCRSAICCHLSRWFCRFVRQTCARIAATLKLLPSIDEIGAPVDKSRGHLRSAQELGRGRQFLKLGNSSAGVNLAPPIRALSLAVALIKGPRGTSGGRGQGKGNPSPAPRICSTRGPMCCQNSCWNLPESRWRLKKKRRRTNERRQLVRAAHTNTGAEASHEQLHFLRESAEEIDHGLYERINGSACQ